MLLRLQEASKHFCMIQWQEQYICFGLYYRCDNQQTFCRRLPINQKHERFVCAPKTASRCLLHLSELFLADFFDLISAFLLQLCYLHLWNSLAHRKQLLNFRTRISLLCNYLRMNWHMQFLAGKLQYFLVHLFYLY